VKIVETIVELEMKGGVPMWDIKVPTLAGKPAPVRTLYYKIERSKIDPKRATLIACVVLAVNPDAEKIVRRFGLLTPHGEIPAVLAQSAQWHATFMHPNEFPVSLYEFDPNLDDTAEDEHEPDQQLDILRALAAHQRAANDGATEDEAVQAGAFSLIADALDRNKEAP
jgi:hypothetical protein